MPEDTFTKFIGVVDVLSAEIVRLNTVLREKEEDIQLLKGKLRRTKASEINEDSHIIG